MRTADDDDSRYMRKKHIYTHTKHCAIGRVTLSGRHPTPFAAGTRAHERYALGASPFGSLLWQARVYRDARVRARALWPVSFYAVWGGRVYEEYMYSTM